MEGTERGLPEEHDTDLVSHRTFIYIGDYIRPCLGVGLVPSLLLALEVCSLFIFCQKLSLPVLMVNPRVFHLAPDKPFWVLLLAGCPWKGRQFHIWPIEVIPCVLDCPVETSPCSFHFSKNYYPFWYQTHFFLS